MKRRELRELMNCCRPDLRDLTEEEARALVEALEQDPVLRDEWQAMQSWDAAIGRVFHDVPVPDGLADRLVAAVTAGRRPGQDDASAPPDERRRGSACRKNTSPVAGLADRTGGGITRNIRHRHVGPVVRRVGRPLDGGTSG